MTPPTDAGSTRGGRYACIHGHFYQPPRDDPWLETVPFQRTACPWHDWNARVAAECYLPNAAAALGAEAAGGRVNNYARMSFDFGPTLLAWLERHEPATYEAILAADRLSSAHFGRGSALAHPFHHVILPLADARDRITEVRSGLADFARRFGRPAEGMWLPETAVDRLTLRVLIDEGVRFVVLAPHQVTPRLPHAIRASEGGLDPTRAYAVDLGAGASLAVFAYDGEIAHEVAFGGLLHDGDRFAARLRSGFRPSSPAAALVHIATDGETYGHHHRFGEMALARAIGLLEAADDVELTNYASFLARHAPHEEADIRDGTSWSCPHGLERWRSGCSCSGGRGTHWSHAWRGPLRAALEELRGRLAALFEREAAPLLRDPWAARDAYMQAQPELWTTFGAALLEAHATHALDAAEVVRARSLLEMERHALGMFTSCAWFFDDIAGIETVQVLQIADRALGLAEELTGVSLASEFTAALARALGNRPAWPTGEAVYTRLVIPARFDAARAAAAETLLALLGLGAGRTPAAYAATLVASETGSPAIGAPSASVDTRPAPVTSAAAPAFLAARWQIEHARTGAAEVFDACALRLSGRRCIVGVSRAGAGRLGDPDRPRAAPAPDPGRAIAVALEADGPAAAAAMIRSSFERVWNGLRCLTRDDRRRVLRETARGLPYRRGRARMRRSKG